MRAGICSLIILGSILITERSVYGITLTVVFFGFIFMVITSLVGFLTRIFGDTRQSTILIIFAFSPIIFLTLYFAAFGAYLNGGTMFFKNYPLVVDGVVMFYGKVFVFFYTLVMTSIILITKVGGKNG